MFNVPAEMTRESIGQRALPITDADTFPFSVLPPFAICTPSARGTWVACAVDRRTGVAAARRVSSSQSGRDFLLAEGFPPVPGASIIADFLNETLCTDGNDQGLMPAGSYGRAEVRRLMSWFNDKFFAEVSGPLSSERLFKRHTHPDPRQTAT